MGLLYRQWRPLRLLEALDFFKNDYCYPQNSWNLNLAVFEQSIVKITLEESQIFCRET